VKNNARKALNTVADDNKKLREHLALQITSNRLLLQNIANIWQEGYDQGVADAFMAEQVADGSQPGRVNPYAVKDTP